jgi:hypothetical protein
MDEKGEVLGARFLLHQLNTWKSRDSRQQPHVKTLGEEYYELIITPTASRPFSLTPGCGTLDHGSDTAVHLTRDFGYLTSTWKAGPTCPALFVSFLLRML